MIPARPPSADPAIQSFSLLETMRLEKGRLMRLEGHLARLAASAGHFNYPWDEPAVRRALDACSRAHPDGLWRVRLLVSSAGDPRVECTPYVPDAPRPWRVALADAPIDPRDPFVLNKTTNRVVYETARRNHADMDDVVLWNTRGEITESTIANVVAEIDGTRYTPPVSCGLLAGVFRTELVNSGAVRERVLTKADLAAATRLWLINSVREWIDATLVREPSR